MIALTREAIATTQAAVSATCEYCAVCTNEVQYLELWKWSLAMFFQQSLTVAAVGKMSASELSELEALMAVEKQTGQKISAESLEKLMLDSGSKRELEQRAK